MRFLSSERMQCAALSAVRVPVRMRVQQVVLRHAHSCSTRLRGKDATSPQGRQRHSTGLLPLVDCSATACAGHKRCSRSLGAISLVLSAEYERREHAPCAGGDDAAEHTRSLRARK
jgi:hypothetical protein